MLSHMLSGRGSAGQIFLFCDLAWTIVVLHLVLSLGLRGPTMTDVLPKRNK